MLPAASSQYTRTAVVLHWIVGLALIAQIAFGFVIDDLAPSGTPSRGAVINLHKSIGILLAIAVATRLLWRLRHPPPAWPAPANRLERVAAQWMHAALYLCMVTMPLSGYVGSNFSKHGVRFFGIPLKPWGPDLPAVYTICNDIHIATAYVFVALIAGHVLAALHHALIRRDGIFSRMRIGQPRRT